MRKIQTALIALLIIITGCKKEEIITITKSTGKVIERSTNAPLPGIKVAVSNGQRDLVATTTNAEGRFEFTVDFDKVTASDSLLLDGRPDLPSKKYELKGIGKAEYDYGTLWLYDKSDESQLPVVTTDSIVSVGSTKAFVAGTVFSNGGFELVERGICYATHQTPTVNDSISTAGSEMGSFTCQLSNLTLNTTYYIRAYATNSIGTKYGEQKSFTTIDGLASVITADATNVTETTATIGGEVVDDGGFAVTKRGVCYSTRQMPDFSDQVKMAGSGIGAFICEIGNLTPVTDYYFKAFAINAIDTVFGEQKSFKTPAKTYSVIVSTSPSNGGEVTGGGVFEEGSTQTVVATENTGYTFVNWTEDGNAVSTDARYSFTLNGDRTLVAHFQLKTYTVTTSSNPANGGSTTGDGTFNHGQSCTLRATPADDYTFLRWTKTGAQVSTEPNYTFDVTESGNYVAHFTNQPLSFTVSVSANPSNGGTVTGGGTFEMGQSCTVRAVANSGYVFASWTENGTVVSGDANYTFPVAGDRTLKANFTVSQNAYTVTASANPPDGGTVEGGGSFNQGQSCTVTATPNTGYEFVKWTENGNKVSDDSSYTFTVSGNRTLVAQFQILSYTILASTNPTNAGSVTGSGTYNYEQHCTLKAIPASGYEFDKWTKNGTLVSNDATYEFTVTETAAYVAHFRTQSYTITTSSNPSNGGNTTGDGTYNHGQNCTLTATPNNGFSFVKWTKSGTQVSTQNPFTFNVTASGEYVAHFQTQSYQVSVSANPNNGGVVSGGGSYNYGQSCTVTAIANTGYEFTNWTENGNPVSTNASYTFTVTGNRTLVANFTLQSYAINVSANPSIGGGVSGGGTYYYGDVCTVTATAVSGYAFNNWTEGGQVCTGNATYSFTVIGNRTLVANFIDNTNPPPGAINGLFTVNPNGLKVYFSSGNLQYIGSTATWKFADEQWDHIGTSQGNNQYNTTRDLFGWGTSGYPHRQSYYQPWSTGKHDYYNAYDDPLLNLFDGNGQADWGYNAISNGGDVENSGWRTLTIEEWDYVFNSRTPTSGVCYVKARVNGYNGVVLLPDDWNSTYNLIYPNQSFPSFNTNTIDLAAWETYFEPYGAVFLPLTGYRSGTDVNYSSTDGRYWSSSCDGEVFAYKLSFTDTGLSIGGLGGGIRKYCGLAVRLVRNVE